MNPDVDAFLAHHGIKGQKWGIRHEPKKGSGRVGNSNNDEAIAVLAPFAPILAIYGAVAVANFKDAGRFHSIAERGRRALTSKDDWNKKPELSRKMSSDAIMSNVVKQINPEYSRDKRGSKANCRRCTFAYEMRRRGNDVKATLSTRATGQGARGLYKAVSSNKSQFHGETLYGKHLIHNGHDSNHGSEIFKSLSKEPNGARGELGVKYIFGGGHSVAWENINRKPVIFDAQSGKRYSSPKDLSAFLSSSHVVQSSYTRLDNANLNQAFLTRWLDDADKS